MKSVIVRHSLILKSNTKCVFLFIAKIDWMADIFLTQWVYYLSISAVYQPRFNALSASSAICCVHDDWIFTLISSWSQWVHLLLGRATCNLIEIWSDSARQFFLFCTGIIFLLFCHAMSLRCIILHAWSEIV